MLKNFFKTAFRNILKYKAYAFINFVGLTCGLALALLIITYVRSELSYDRFHEKADRLYRMRYTAPNGLEIASSPPPIAPVLKDYFPEVEEAARVYLRNVSITRPNNAEAFEESGVLFADSALAKMFTFEFVKGNPKRALCDKFTVLINEEMAKKYFGDANPIGESLIFSGRQSFKVVGVVKDFPENSHIRFNMLVPYDNMFDLETPQTAEVLRKNLDINFIISHSYTYVLLKPGTTSAHINSSMGDFLKKYAQPRFLVGQVFQLMPLLDIHLKSTLLAEPSSTNSMANIYIFVGVGILTLIIACINYINLSTAQSFSRIKEIGIRKILGSMKFQLIVQFLAESFLFSLLSMAFAYAVFHLTLPLLNLLTGKHLVFAEAVDVKLIVASVLLLLFITAMAGGYPAYFVTQFESVNALKGHGKLDHGSQFFRKALVVFQLAIACMLLSASLLIVKQLRYLEDRPLGFLHDQVINIPLTSQNLNGIFSQRDSAFSSRLETFRHTAEGLAGVKLTTLSSGAPGLGVIFHGITPEGFTPEDNMFIANMSVDYDFLKSYDMELVAGRGFSREHGTDAEEGYVVNETAVREFKWETPQNALGKTVNKEGKKGKVIGVVKDFNFASLSTPMSALVLDLDADQFTTLSITFQNANGQDIINKLEADWNKLFPEKAFEYGFLDDALNGQYNNYRDFGTIIQAFTGIAILISCLGVYGLVLFTVQRKVKEIGVRKVLGANVKSILMLIYRDFAVLIVLGFVIAVPVSYYLMNQWLTNFVYHTDITATSYVISLVMVLVIVTLTVSYQAVRAALANPVTSLRSE
ncbi:ABC transporter permease [Chryseolinea lacunae]|uniref:ABC transporter permease n=1 Tax=Chryseolinea lacunae TaxID=2801331 RepID=A0ABS1KYH7_9BACT|nr:ABC transporter permease [Chryseolinea lacunae]MBL0744505.1 ABC transporter permease [Chryseolinea lacunae]